MTISAAEQYMLELINRTRLDPVGEAALHGVALNASLAPGKLGTQVRSVLATNADLDDSATGHSKWMLAADKFSHTGNNGSTPFQRMKAEGFAGGTMGENISWRGQSSKINLDTIIATQHADLFKSAGHRVNMLADGYREVGISQEAGIFSTGKSNFNTSMVTQNFGRNGSDVFVTGVAYADKNADNFYSVGEGRAGVTFATAANTTTTAAAGGYALKIAPGAAVDVTGTVGALAFSVRLDVSFGNAKLDVVNGDTFFTATDITLQTGINKARLLGTADLDATGNAAANDLQGNKAANILSGLDGLDNLFGGAGNDTLLGGAGNDKLSGGDGADSLLGGSGLDVLIGGAGADRLNGEAGADVLTGGLGADAFVFTADGGKDRVTDFARDDRLLIDNAIWGNTALTAKQVVAQFGEMVGRTAVLDFDNGQSITLTGVTKLAGLDAYITII